MTAQQALTWLLGQQSSSQDFRITFDEDYPEGYEGPVSGHVGNIGSLLIAGGVSEKPFITVSWNFGLPSGEWGNVWPPDDYEAEIVTITDAEYPEPDRFHLDYESGTGGTWDTGIGIVFEQPGAYMAVNLRRKSDGATVAQSGWAKDSVLAASIIVYSRSDVDYPVAQTHLGSNGNWHAGFIRAGAGAELIARVIKNETGRFLNSTEYAEETGFQGLIRSFWVPFDDPAYGYSGGIERTSGYRLEQRSWIYDDALAVYAFTASGDNARAAQVLNALQVLQADDGSLPFSLDVFLGRVFDDYIRTGAIAWVGMAATYYQSKTGDNSFETLATRIADYLLTLQDNDPTSDKYGSVRGGFGSYDADYQFVPTEIQWASTEHNIDCYFLFRDLGVMLRNNRFMSAAGLVRSSLLSNHWNAEQNRFNQGVGDDAEALDCASWGGLFLHAIGDYTKRDQSLAFMEAFRIDGQNIATSTGAEDYNTQYSHPGPIGGYVPYRGGYDDPPQTVWGEGTAGAVLLKMRTDMDYDPDIASLERMQAADPRHGILYVSRGRASLPYEFHAWPATATTGWYATILLDAGALFASEAPAPVVPSPNPYDPDPNDPDYGDPNDPDWVPWVPPPYPDPPDMPPDPFDGWLPDPFDPWADMPDSPIEECATLLDRIREFSATVKRAVRITGPRAIEMVNPSTPLPTGWARSDANTMYSTTTQKLSAETDVLSILAGDLNMEVTANLINSDARLINSTWQIPNRLPVYSMGAAPVKRITMTFTPTTLSASVEFHYLSVPLEVRRT